jgi:hypothetical protein
LQRPHLSHLREAGVLRAVQQGPTLGCQRRNLFTQALVMGLHPPQTTPPATRDG